MTGVALPAVHPVLRGSPYQGYVYAYPHKTAYRPLPVPRPLTDVWAAEPRGALFLYVHVPFCTMRCGFCNLFTRPNPDPALVPLYLDALRREADAVRAAIPDARFARFCVGGGTPTYLDERELETVFDLAEATMGADLAAVPACVETSPDTVTPEKIAVLKARGIDRVSVGVQSFVEAETAASGRPQTRAIVDTALSRLTAADFPTLNIDLIYGLPGQTPESWRFTLREALRFRPEELFLYPLYVRPLTGLGRSALRRGDPRPQAVGIASAWDDVRLACYRDAREILLSEGYSQVSMRMFRRSDAPEVSGPAYCCQTDGMVGLGVGARSYTRDLHYSAEYAVGAKGVRAIIADYVSRDAAEFAAAGHGFALDADEQRRRFVLQSLLNADGLDAAAYHTRFGTAAAADFPELDGFVELGLLDFRPPGRWTPTPLGLERSDALGPWFFSPAVRGRMAEYDPR